MLRITYFVALLVQFATYGHAYLPVDVIVDEKAKQRHRIDTLNLLAYAVLLVLVRKQLSITNLLRISN